MARTSPMTTLRIGSSTRRVGASSGSSNMSSWAEYVAASGAGSTTNESDTAVTQLPDVARPSEDVNRAEQRQLAQTRNRLRRRNLQGSQEPHRGAQDAL